MNPFLSQPRAIEILPLYVRLFKLSQRLVARLHPTKRANTAASSWTCGRTGKSGPSMTLGNAPAKASFRGKRAAGRRAARCCAHRLKVGAGPLRSCGAKIQ